MREDSNAAATPIAHPTAIPSVSDSSLVRQLRSGSEAAATHLYGRYARRLRALARAKASADLNPRVDADDIIQSVFRRFFVAAQEGDYDVPAGEDLWNLLLVITLNKIRSEEAYHRAAKRDVRRTAAIPADESPLEAVAGHDEAADLVLRLAVKEFLERLPAEYRDVVEFRIQEYEVAEIAQLTHRSKRSVERILQESRKA